MIAKMTKYSFVLPTGAKEEFLEELSAFGLVDISRSSKPVDDNSEQIMSEIDSTRQRLKELRSGEDQTLKDMRANLSSLEQARLDVLPWGDFDKERLEGFNPHFFSVQEKKFDPALEGRYPLCKVGTENGIVRFVILGDDLPADLKELPAPGHTVREYDDMIARSKGEIKDYEQALHKEAGSIPELEAKEKSLNDRLNLYLASLTSEEAAEGAISVYEGFAPTDKDEELSGKLDTLQGVYWMKEKATVGDRPPIELHNNRFVKMFEPITDMYGRPGYDGFDPTPFISIFFLLFFAMCMGDAAYGIILVIAGLLLRKVKSFASLAPLVVTLGLGTVVVGFFFHTFFSVDISGWFPESVQKIMVPQKVAGYDGTMVLSIIVGIIHICLAMVVKTICATRSKGFLNSLGIWGWTLLIVGGVTVGATALAGVIDAAATKIIIIIIGVVSALGIFLLNNLHRNPLLNIGAGLWETYNTATGLLGDVLSYLRLYALGLAGSMLGFAFNDLAKMMLGDGGFGWIPFILIEVVGHTLNIAMAALGAFVHPLRLNFLEFFKNSGYEGSGKKYNPLKNQSIQ